MARGKKTLRPALNGKRGGGRKQRGHAPRREEVRCRTEHGVRLKQRQRYRHHGGSRADLHRGERLKRHMLRAMRQRQQVQREAGGAQ